MSWLNIGAAIVSGVMGTRSKKSSDARNRKSTVSTNALAAAEALRVTKFNKREAKAARKFAREERKGAQAYNRLEVAKARKFDKKQSIAAAKFDAAQIETQRRWSSQEARRERTFNMREAAKARASNIQQTERERQWNRREAMAAENRGRKYAADDRDEYREYSNPAAVRARLEAAGINPLSGFVDASTAYVPGGTALAPASAGTAVGAQASGAGVPGTSSATMSPARSAVASSQAASAGVAQGVAATFGTFYESSSNFAGDALTDAASHYSTMKMQEVEQAVRQTELELEGQRVAALIEQSKRPRIGGIYSGSTERTVYRSVPGAATTGTQRRNNGAPASAVGGRDPWINDRELEIMPMGDGPGITRISNPLTGGNPIYVPGADGEPWGIDEVLTGVIFGVPQVPAAAANERFGHPSEIGPRVVNKGLDYWSRNWADKFALPDADKLPFNLPAALGRNSNSRFNKRNNR